jgi:hypothetical protein
LNGNEKTTLSLAFLATISGLFVYFLPQDKAVMYISIPTTIAGITGAVWQSKNKNDAP